jgi:hypothetical protein
VDNVRKLESELDREFRSLLRLSPEVYFQVLMRVDGDEPVWMALITDGLNERVVAKSPVFEGLKHEVRKTLGARGGIRSFWEQFWMDDPVFCEKAAGEEFSEPDENEVTDPYDHDFSEGSGEPSNPVQEAIQALRELHKGDFSAAKITLAHLALSLALKSNMVEALVSDPIVGELYEVSVKVKGV